MGFFILEDLGEHISLVEPLLTGNAAEAEAALIKYAACLGKLHAATQGKVSAYTALFESKLPGLKLFGYELDELDTRMANIRLQLEQLGVPTGADYQNDVQAVVDEITRPGIFQAFIHADPCPDNVFDQGDHFRLIDFEFGHFGHALIDAVYPRMIFTTCWCANRIPPEVVARFEQRYREELIKGCPQAQDDTLWKSALLNLCAYTLLRTISMHLDDGLKEDSEWGRASIRQRVVVRLQAFIAASEEFHGLSALQTATIQLLDILQTRWPETAELPFYPAFDPARP